MGKNNKVITMSVKTEEKKLPKDAISLSILETIGKIVKAKQNNSFNFAILNSEDLSNLARLASAAPIFAVINGLSEDHIAYARKEIEERVGVYPFDANMYRLGVNTYSEYQKNINAASIVPFSGDQEGIIKRA